MDFNIAQGEISQAFELAKSIPEFSDQIYGLSEYTDRLNNQSSILIGYHHEIPVGFKVGYPRGSTGSFYSWLGGVIPEYRRKGVARKLAEYQEKWALTQGFSHIWFKTRNRNRAMIIFALNNGFYLIDIQSKISLRTTE